MVNVRYFLEEHFIEILFLLGVILLFFGVATLKTFGSLLSAGSLFLGVLIFVFSLFARLGIFSVRFRSLDGLSVIFICCSIVLFDFAIVVLEFLTSNISVDLFAFRHKTFYELVFSSERPYLWISKVFMFFGLVLLVIGFVLKVYSILKD